MNIGKIERTKIVEPLEDPVPWEDPEPVRDPEPIREPEPVPAWSRMR